MIKISVSKATIRLSANGWLCYRTLCGPSYRRDFKDVLAPNLRVVACAIVSEEHMYEEIKVSLWYTIDYCKGTEKTLNYKTASHEWRFRRTLAGCKDAGRVVRAVREAIEQQADSDIQEFHKHHSRGLPILFMFAGKGSLKVNTAEIVARMKSPPSKVCGVIDRVSISSRA